MGAYIIIALLFVLFVAVVVLDIFKEKARKEEVTNLTDRINYMENQNDHLNKEIAEVNLKFSGSLDTREKNYDDIYMKLKKIEIELEKSEMENERLRAKLAVLESQKETENGN
jgi:septal ring factor EnvC (AmiA/AmiB activator)